MTLFIPYENEAHRVQVLKGIRPSIKAHANFISLDQQAEVDWTRLVFLFANCTTKEPQQRPTASQIRDSLQSIRENDTEWTNRATDVDQLEAEEEVRRLQEALQEAALSSDLVKSKELAERIRDLKSRLN